jgi:hypothetical protein
MINVQNHLVFDAEFYKNIKNISVVSIHIQNTNENFAYCTSIFYLTIEILLLIVLQKTVNNLTRLRGCVYIFIVKICYYYYCFHFIIYIIKNIILNIPSLFIFFLVRKKCQWSFNNKILIHDFIRTSICATY